MSTLTNSLAAKDLRTSDKREIRYSVKLGTNYAISSPLYYESFPFSDLLICEFDSCSENVTNQIFTKPSLALVENPKKNGGLTLPERTNSPRGDSFSPAVVRLSRVAQYIYQRVVRRKPVPYQPSPRNQKYLLCYVEETLECGHKVTVYPSEIETLTARRRNCHECSGWFGGLKLPKKPVEAVKREVRRKAAGKSLWPLVFAGCCVAAIAFLAYEARPVMHYHVRVIQQFGPREFLLEENGVRAVRHFCDDVPFEPGFTLTTLEVKDEGQCWTTRIFDPAYVIERDAKGWPTLPANCTNSADKPVECKGEPKW